MKAIVVIDMPDEVDPSDYELSYALLGHKKGKFPTYATVLEVRGAIKPLPEKKEASVYNIEDIMKTEVNLGEQVSAMVRLNTDKLIALGYNWCLEEIEK